MSVDALLPCLVCGKTLKNVTHTSENQPSEGTEFRTYGHYGSTFWDSFDGEELVLNVCDACLNERKDRLGQHKRYLPITCDGMHGFGRQWVDRPIVAYSGHADQTSLRLEPEELGTDMGPTVRWPHDIGELKQFALDRAIRPVLRILKED